MKIKFIAPVLFLLMSFFVASANSVRPINTTNTISNTNIDSLIRSKIEQKYKNAVILEIKNEDGNIEVEIIHDQKEKDVVFNSLGVWQSTKYDIFKSELSKKIKEVIKKSKYSSYSIDSIEVIETPARLIYEIELDKWFSDDITIYVTFDGEIL